jgi:sulfite reductase (ferredoxin)
MKTSNALWKVRLEGKLPPILAQEVDIFENEIELRRQGKIEDKIFAETRLRRGVYGQRYDNGQRFDGKQNRRLAYPADHETKGPHTLWDAPGMQRIKIPYGGLNPDQLEVMAELAEEYSDGIAHVTTRQDFQLHFIQLDDTPALMRRLAAAGITTREACGNSVRNVTGCPYMGVCPDEPFDVTPYARALSKFLLGHPDAQNFGRKFKPTFSGCAQHACGLAWMHDLGYTAVTRVVDGKVQRGFKFVVGGGLGAVPYPAKVFDEFLPPEELLPVAQAIARIFGKYGEKQNRARARMKFLVQNWGIEKFRQMVMEERAKLPHDPQWTEFLKDAENETEAPLKPPGELPAANGNERYNRWLKTNIREQKQPGYVVVTISLPLGDITANQLRSLADIARKFTLGTIRATVEQNFVIRWVSQSDVPALFAELDAVGLGEPGAGNILDIVACPGTDTCKLGISSSRGLASELRRRLQEKSFQMDQAVQDLHIKVSGCFNSCGQHHVADIGFYGVNRMVKGFQVPHFQVVLGGQWDENAGSFGLPVVAIPSKRIPDALDRITGFYLTRREKNERFTAFVRRIGKAEIRGVLEELAKNAPDHDADRSFYSDWRDPREYGTGDVGVGECAGEVVTTYQFAMTDAERLVFEAQIDLEKGNVEKAGKTAYLAMLKSARALVQTQYDDISNDADEIVGEFRERYYDTKLFFDPFAHGKFGQYLFGAHESAGRPHTAESAHQLIEEAQLFIEATHSCYNRWRFESAAAAGGKS